MQLKLNNVDKLVFADQTVAAGNSRSIAEIAQEVRSCLQEGWRDGKSASMIVFETNLDVSSEHFTEAVKAAVKALKEDFDCTFVTAEKLPYPRWRSAGG